MVVKITQLNTMYRMNMGACNYCKRAHCLQPSLGMQSVRRVVRGTMSLVGARRGRDSNAIVRLAAFAPPQFILTKLIPSLSSTAPFFPGIVGAFCQSLSDVCSATFHPSCSRSWESSATACQGKAPRVSTGLETNIEERHRPQWVACGKRPFRKCR